MTTDPWIMVPYVFGVLTVPGVVSGLINGHLWVL